MGNGKAKLLEVPAVTTLCKFLFFLPGLWLHLTIASFVAAAEAPVRSPFPAANPTAEKIVSLQEAVAMALAANPTLQAARNGLAAKEDEIGMTGADLLPKISVEERVMRTSNPTYGFMAKLNQERFTADDFAIDSLNHPEPITDYQTTLALEMMLFVPKARIGHEMSRTAFAAAEQRFGRQQEQIVADVARACLMVLTSARYVDVSIKALDDAREHKRIAQLRYDNGQGLYSDTLRAATAVIEAEQQLVSARKNLAVAKRTLGLLLGLSEPVAVRPGYPAIPVQEVDYYCQAAMARKDLKALAEQRRNAENNLKLAEAGLLPTLGVGSSYQRNDHRWPVGGEGDSWQVTGFLRWELFDGNRRKYEASRARHQLAEKIEYLKGMEKAVLFKVHEAYLAVEESTRKAELARAALQSAEESQRLVETRYENSLAPLVDLLDVQVSLDRARAAGTANENGLQAAIINLGYESGTILNDLQIEASEPEEDK
jgi:outer membrane protein